MATKRKTKVSRKVVAVNPDKLPGCYSYKDLEPPQSLDQRLADSEEEYEKHLETCSKTEWHGLSTQDDTSGAHSRTHFKECRRGDFVLHKELLNLGLSHPVPDLPGISGTMSMFDLWDGELAWTRKARALLQPKENGSAPVAGKRITLVVAEQWFKVSRPTLKRAIKRGPKGPKGLKSYPDENGYHQVLLEDVARYWPRREPPQK
jgi:hypothetical protein